MWLIVLMILAGMAIVFFYKKPLDTSGAWTPPPPQPPWPQPQPGQQPVTHQQVDQRSLPAPRNDDQPHA